MPGWRTGRAEQELAERWGEVSIQVKDEILERGVRDEVFRQHYETDALDASTLLIPLVRFLPPTDDRVRKTVQAIDDELTRDGLVLRYRVDDTDDGLHGEEATFTICSFWLASALLRDRRAGEGAGALRAAARARRARSTSTPRSSTRAAAATGETSPRPSPTWP